MSELRPPTDKFSTGLANAYTKLFGDWRPKPIRVLEIGIWKGGSLWFWSELFPHPESLIVGVDIRIPPGPFPANPKIYACNQNDVCGLQQIASQHGPFDLIVDDGSHFTTETRVCFDTLFTAVKTGGYYVIEDWAVGYWKDRDSRFGGMVEIVTDIMQHAPDKSIGSVQISLHPGRAFAAFFKGAEGWKR